MNDNVRQVFMEPLETSGCSVRKNHPYGKTGVCFSVDNQDRRMDYWMYSYEDLFTVSVCDMCFQEDFTNTFSLSEFVSIYYYDSVKGYELPSMQPVHCGRVAAYVAKGESYTATYLGKIPVRGVSVHITPAYYKKHLTGKLPVGFKQLKEVFSAFNQREDSPALLMVLRQIQNCRITGNAAHLYYESKVNEAIAIIFSQAEREEKIIHHTLSDKQQLQQVERFLADRYAGDVSLKELAKLACMSVSKLKYTFKSVYGCNIFEYIRNLRLDHAKKLLLYSTSSITEIAALVGYKTTSAFTKTFKERTGFLPKDYRKIASGAQ